MIEVDHACPVNRGDLVVNTHRFCDVFLVLKVSSNPRVEGNLIVDVLTLKGDPEVRQYSSFFLRCLSEVSPAPP